MKNIKKLIIKLQNYKGVFIQTHNFPDHDAIGTAYGLQQFLLYFDIKSKIIYDGEITRNSLQLMIDRLNINVYHVSQINNTEFKDYALIIVDSCSTNKNIKIVDDVNLIGIIDHHSTCCNFKKNNLFFDVRTNYGACSTIIYTYFKKYKFKINPLVATALLIGICIDTANLMRHVSKNDLEAYYKLFQIANVDLFQSIIRNNIEISDLKFYKKAIDNVIFEKNLAFCYIDEECSPSLLGILSDFFLSLDEIEFVMVCAKYNQKIIFSLRSEKAEWNAASIIQKLLKINGAGGGHHNMAGGAILNKNFNYKLFFNELKSLLFLN